MTPLKSFRVNHGLANSIDLRPVAVAVETTSEAYKIARDHLIEIDNKSVRDGVTLHVHLNMMGRVFEQTQGMLVCIAANRYTSGEALARVVVEGAINLMFMCLKGDAATVADYLGNWLDEHDRKLSTLEAHEQASEHAQHVVPMIRERRELITSYREFFVKLLDACNLDLQSCKGAWPQKLISRFEQLERKSDYFESYHRLSGSSHVGGEDAFLWLLSLSASVSEKRRIGDEARSYSIMMSRIAALMFVESAAACAASHGHAEEAGFLEMKAKLSESVAEIAMAAGVPV